ncbi:SPW repeat protein [uncultured Ferrovibrio sp.]|jgi:hypothetical protein|uniref:SPW repeat protein n=1 Tax=uncultured Ferrovibrio sp. TaxID=1576913 RepID=UPI0026116E7D|nr:SPW repeat protein [uncultured Ferrovibrio sp.]
MAHVTHNQHDIRHPHEIRRWQDWTNMALGILAAISPWLFGFTGFEGATLNAVIIGFLVFALSALALTLLDSWEAYINAQLGAWLALSPWLLAFSHYDMIKFVHLSIGALIVAVAVLGIWQGQHRQA